jgi:putative oxidoreductase
MSSTRARRTLPLNFWQFSPVEWLVFLRYNIGSYNHASSCTVELVVGNMKTFFKTVPSLLLGIFFIMAGGKKLLGQEAQIDSFFRWGYPLWFLYLIGAIELVGGICLLIPQVRFFAVLVLSVTMVGAFLTHLRAGEMAAVPVPLVLLVLLLILAWTMRRSPGKTRSGTDSPG